MRPVTRRAVLGGLLASPLLAACAGFDTSGAAAPGTVGFLSTQFTPVEERQRYEQVLRSRLSVPVAYNPVEGGVFTTTITSQAKTHNVRTALIGGLYNDLAPLADAFDDVSGLLRELGGAGYPDDILKLTTLGGTTPKFVPWMQATYIVAVNKQALHAGCPPVAASASSPTTSTWRGPVTAAWTLPPTNFSSSSVRTRSRAVLDGSGSSIAPALDPFAGDRFRDGKILAVTHADVDTESDAQGFAPFGIRSAQ